MGALTNKQLVQYAQAYVANKAQYWYGTTGEIATKQLYERKQKQYPNVYPSVSYEESDYIDADGKIVMDCSGLIKACLNASEPGAPAPYNKENDLSAAGFYNVGCDKKGKYDTFPGKPGMLLFREQNGSIVHVGIYAGNNLVIESRGHAYGVVITSTLKRSWQYWGQCKFIKENDDVIDTDKLNQYINDIDQLLNKMRNLIN